MAISPKYGLLIDIQEMYGCEDGMNFDEIKEALITPSIDEDIISWADPDILQDNNLTLDELKVLVDECIEEFKEVGYGAEYKYLLEAV